MTGDQGAPMSAPADPGPRSFIVGRVVLRLWCGAMVVAAIALAGLVLPQTAGAEECERDDEAEARRLKRRGWDLRDDDPEEAAEAFKTAHELCPDPWYLGHLALLYEKMGRIQKAIEYVDAYLDSDDAGQRRQALAGKERLEALLGSLRIRTEPPGAELRIDGEELDNARFTPALVKMDPGSHLIELRLEDYRTAKREITIESGQERRFKVALEPIEGPSTEPEPEPDRSVHWTGSAQLGVGVTFPIGTKNIGTAFAIPIDVSGGLDFRAARLELLFQAVIFPDVNGLIAQVGGGIRLGVRLGSRPLYLGAELVLGLSQVNVNTDGRRIPVGKYSSFGLEPALFLSWQVIERIELVARLLRFEVMGLSGDLPGGTAIRLGLDVGVRVRF